MKNVIGGGVSALTVQNFPAHLLSSWAQPAPAPPQVVRVALVVSDQSLRQLVAQQLAGDPRTQLIAWARTLHDGQRLTARADVVLVGLDLEDGSGFDLVPHVNAASPGTKVIVVARHESEEAALRAFELGAAGCLVLQDWVGNFVLPILNVANGGSVLSPALVRRLMRRQAPIATRLGTADATLASITGREREVLAQVARGLRSKEIARQLAISDETVNAHVKSIYRKLHVNNRAQLVRLASQAGAL